MAFVVRKPATGPSGERPHELTPGAGPGRSRQRARDRSLFHGMAWTAVAGWAGQFVSWAVLLYAARVLTPGDFGLAAMAMIPIGLARLIEDLGLDAALVQKRSLGRAEVAQLGGLAVMFGTALCLVYLALAGVIAAYFDETAVASLIRVLSVLFVLDALQMVPRAMLQRDLAFGKLALVNAVQLIVRALTLGACAWFGLSFWSLVLNHVLASMLAVLLLNHFRPHPLAIPRQWSRLWGSIRFGGHMLVSSVAWYLYSRADDIVLGRYAGKDALGAYGFATDFSRIALSEVGSVSGKVVPGVFSSVQHARGQLVRYFLLLTEAPSYLTVPATIGIALIAEDLVPLAIGPQWTETILPLQLLSIYVTMGAVTSLFSHVFIWTGRSAVNMWLNLLTLAMIVPAFVFAGRHGAAAVALAWVILFPITLIPAWICLKRALRLRFRRYLGALGPALISTACMCPVVIGVREFISADFDPMGAVAAQVLAGAASYTVVMLLLFRRRVARIIGIVRRAL